MSTRLSPQPAATGFDQTHFLESLVCDMHWTCLHAGTIAYLVQAGCRLGSDAQLGAWRHLLGDNTAALQLGLRYGVEAGLPAGAVTTLLDFLDGLSGGLARTQQSLARGGAHKPVPLSELRHLLPVWSEIARRADHALTALEAPTRAALTPEYAANARIIAAFLQESLRGDVARLNEWGEITLPELAQRRLHARARVERTCQLEIGEETITAGLRNVSRAGLGVSCAASLPQGTRIVVCLDDGRRLQAEVARSDEGEMGLKLLLPLSQNDPLFRV